jgi:hypothetical protein
MEPYIDQLSSTKAYYNMLNYQHVDPKNYEPPLRIVDGAVLAEQERVNRVDVYIRVLYQPGIIK